MCTVQPLSSVLVRFKVSLFHCGVPPLPPKSFLEELQETVSMIKNNIDEYCSGAELQYFFPFFALFNSLQAFPS